MIEYSRLKGLALLMCLDSNCHSSSFGLSNNKRGKILDEFVAKYNLKIENVDKKYTFETTTTSTIINITLSHRPSVSVTDWTVIKDENFTDHNDISFYFQMELIRVKNSQMG